MKATILARLAPVLLCVACLGEDAMLAGTHGISKRDLLNAVTSDMASGVAGGSFDLLPPVDSLPVLSETRARELAEIVGRDFGPMLRMDLEYQHQGRIDFSRLRSCGRAYFARSSFVSIPPDRSDVRFYFGAFWIVGLCGRDGVTSISVAVAANAVDARVVDGRLLPEPNMLRMVGVPPAWDGALPVSPERAAVFASAQTSRLVASVPILYAPNPLDAFPQGAVWIVEMDRDVVVRGEESSAEKAGRRVLVSSTPIPNDAMRRGSVGLFAERPGGRRVLEIPIGWADLPAFSLVVQALTAIDIEPGVAQRGGN